MRYLWVIVCFLATLSCAAADLTTLDPPDPRLGRKVTVEVNHAKLEDLAKQLLEQTGVVIKAGSGARDWRVRERHVTIYAKDVELGKLMQQVSKLLGYCVSREGKNDEWSYLIWQDAKSRALESEMLNSEKEAAAERTKGYRQSALDDAGKALKMTPDEAAELREKDPWLAYLGGTNAGRGLAQMLSVIGTQFPTERDLMLRGRMVSIPVTALPAELQQAVLDSTSGGIFAAERHSREDLSDLQPSQIVMLPIETTEAGMLDAIGIGGAIVVTGARPGDQVAYGGDPFEGDRAMSLGLLSGADSPIAKIFGKYMFALDEGGDVEELGKQFEAEFENSDSLSAAVARKSPTEENPPTEPELTREIEIRNVKYDPRRQSGRGGMQEVNGEVIAEISRAAEITAVFESFASAAPLSLFVRSGKQPFYKVLIALEKAGYTWERDARILGIRPIDWALQRSYEIPESFLASYRQLLDKQGELTFDNLADIAAGLTDDQILRTLASDPDLSYAVTPIHGEHGPKRSLLRLYSSLSVQQKAMLATPNGLGFDQFTNDQWDRMADLINEEIGGIYIIGGAVRRVVEVNDPKNIGPGIPRFEISVFVQGEEQPRVIDEHFVIWNKEQIAETKEMQKKYEEAQKQQQEAGSPP